MSTRLAAALALTGSCLLAVLTGGHARADGELQVAVVGDVKSDAYPQIEATLSVVDPSMGRPVQDLKPEGVVISDDAGRTKLLSLQPTTAAVPTAYVFLVDTSAAMGAGGVQRAADTLRQVTQRLGRQDLVRVVAFNEGVDPRTNWVTKDDPNLAAAINALQATSTASLLAPALTQASDIAMGATGVLQRAVVLLTSVQGKTNEPDLAIESVRSGIRSPFFTISLGRASTRLTSASPSSSTTSPNTAGARTGVSTARPRPASSCACSSTSCSAPGRCDSSPTASRTQASISSALRYRTRPFGAARPRSRTVRAG